MVLRAVKIKLLVLIEETKSKMKTLRRLPLVKLSLSALAIMRFAVLWKR